VSKIQEIENALQELPTEQKWEVAHWLLAELDEAAERSQSPACSKLPDYAARRRQIFGDKVLPNMVLAGRSEERW
jgi:hypothetical protein